jgi:hypothetical protein
VPAASAAWAIEQVVSELRAAYLTVARAGALLERTGADCAHPALRQARRCGADALDLASDAERMLGDGVHRLYAQTGHGRPTSIGELVGVLDTARDQLTTAADRVRQLPARITAAGQQLTDAGLPGARTGSQDGAAGQPDPATEAATAEWNRAAEELVLMTASLGAAVGALSSYTGGLSGAGVATS